MQFTQRETLAEKTNKKHLEIYLRDFKLIKIQYATGINKDTAHRFFACLLCQREDDTKSPCNQLHCGTHTPKDPSPADFSSFPVTQTVV